MYNSPTDKLEVEQLDEIIENVNSPVLWVGDLNAHNPLWGSRGIDENGQVLENFIDKHGLVVLNDGRPTWFRTNQSAQSCCDFSFSTLSSSG